MGISIDSSFVVEIVSFLILWAILKRLLFDPMLHVLEEREKRTEGNLKAAEELREQAMSLRNQHETSIHTVHRSVSEQAEESRKAALETERQIIAEARDAAAARLNKARTEIAEQVEAARQRLSGQAADLAERIASKILGSRAA
jgi:F-type H+-transporting ATPase subunit b